MGTVGDVWARTDRRAGGAARSGIGRCAALCRRRAGASAVRLFRSRNHGAERRRGHAGVSRRLRLVRRGRRVRHAAVPADAARRRARAARGGRRGVRARRRARHLQRQVVRRAGARDAVPVSPARRGAGRELPHVDVLHPARRFWSRGRLTAGTHRSDEPDGCSLLALERAACSARGASATCPASRFRAATSSSSAAATRGRSRRCSSTTGSICCRWPA